jgi:hypothetical protein
MPRDLRLLKVPLPSGHELPQEGMHPLKENNLLKPTLLGFRQTYQVAICTRVVFSWTLECAML